MKSRAKEGPFVDLGNGAAAKRAPKTRTPLMPPLDLDLAPLEANVYTTYTIRQSHKTALQNDAHARMAIGFARKYDISSVLRDVLDYWQAHEEEVNAWISETHKRQGKR